MNRRMLVRSFVMFIIITVVVVAVVFKVWLFHCLRLDHETMVCAVSFTVLLYKFQTHIRKVRCSTLWLLRIVGNKRKLNHSLKNRTHNCKLISDQKSKQRLILNMVSQNPKKVVEHLEVGAEIITMCGIIHISRYIYGKIVSNLFL